MGLSLLKNMALVWTLAFATATAAHADEPVTLLRNGGFEQTVTVPGVPATGGKHGSWTLKDSPAVPAEWTLSGHFGGELTVLTEGAFEGKRFLRIRAGAERQAHIHQDCPSVRANRSYRGSIRYRGGPVAMVVYEYGAGGSAPRIETVGTGEATGATAGEWRALEAEYYMPDTAVNVRFVAAVEKGQVADVDDFRGQAAPTDATPRAAGWINVLDYGASGSEFQTTATTTAGSKQVTVADVGDFKVG